MGDRRQGAVIQLVCWARG